MQEKNHTLASSKDQKIQFDMQENKLFITVSKEFIVV